MGNKSQGTPPSASTTNVNIDLLRAHPMGTIHPRASFFVSTTIGDICLLRAHSMGTKTQRDASSQNLLYRPWRRKSRSRPAANHHHHHPKVQQEGHRAQNTCHRCTGRRTHGGTPPLCAREGGHEELRGARPNSPLKKYKRSKSFNHSPTALTACGSYQLCVCEVHLGNGCMFVLVSRYLVPHFAQIPQFTPILGRLGSIMA